MVYARAVCCLGLALCLYAQGSAGILDEREFEISQDYSFSEQNHPRIAIGTEGRFAVVWTDYGSSQGDIMCRLYDSGATAVGDNFVLNDDAGQAWQVDPDISSDWLGRYVVVWTDYRNGSFPFDPDIYYQRLDSTGFLGANVNVTIETPDSSHQSPAVAATGSGTTVVSWSDLRNYTWDIFRQQIDGDGNLDGVNGKVNDITTGAQHEPDIALAADRWSVVVWYDNHGGHDDIYLQKFDTAGNPVGTNIRINDDNGTSVQKFPSVAIGGNGTIFVVWMDWRNGLYPADPDIYCQRLDSDLNRLGANLKVNLDGTQSAQRGAQVATDRMGNACIVWADSSTGDWQVMGQMFDYTGLRRGSAFVVNETSSGRQLHPSVAMDGYHLYLVWADSRAGNFDIYGRVIQYNDPGLVAEPSRIDASKDISDPNPSPVTMSITNAGYGELTYRAYADCSWLSVTNDSGMTPADISISFDAAGLGYGIHQGGVVLVDCDNGDSSAYIPVLLTITGPEIDVSPDSLNFKALAEIGAPSTQNILVTNSGSGSLQGDLSVTADWIVLDKQTFGDSTWIQVGCDIDRVTLGDYTGYIVFEDSAALNSPESLKVFLRYETGKPYLAAIPENPSLVLPRHYVYSDSIQIMNLGSSAVSWQASTEASWLTLTAFNGQDNDYLVYTVTTDGLNDGSYSDSFVVADSNAFNNPLIVPIDLEVEVGDTLVVWPAQVARGESVQIPIYLHAHHDIVGGALGFIYDKSMLTVDSIGAPVGSPIIDSVVSVCDYAAGRFTINLQADTTAGIIFADRYHLGDIYATANDSLEGSLMIDAAPEADSFNLLLENDITIRPAAVPGEVTITAPLDVPFEDPAIPNEYSLEQNVPNPFNAATTISFTVKRAGWVRLEIFNILGQHIAVPVDEYLAAGEHLYNWDGRSDSGREMASGIYFYRLSAGPFCAVRKMVFLK
jgi:hypothetical protein